MAAKYNNFTLDPKSSEELQKLAEKLGITQEDVLRKGTLVMALYAKFKEDNKKIIVMKDREKNTETELILA